MTRRLTIAALSILAAVWVFGDTYAKYLGDSRPDEAIRFAHFGGYEDYELWRDVIAEFEATHAGLRVRQEYVVGPGGHYNTKLRQQALAGGLPDVALVQLAPFHDLAEAFGDMEALFADAGDGRPPFNLDGSETRVFRVGGVQRALPISGGNLLVYLNRKSLRAAEEHRGRRIDLPTVDWTLEDFRAFARELTCDFDADGRTDQFGLWLPSWVYFQPFVWALGGAISDPDLHEWTLCGQQAVEAFTFYRDLLLLDRVCPREEDVPQILQDVGFLTGRAAMCVNGPWLMPFLEKTALRDAYDVLPLPTGPAGRFTRMTWDGVVFPANLPEGRRSAVRAFILHLLSESVQQRLARTGRALPALVSAQKDFAAGPRAQTRAAFLDGLTYARVQPLYPNFGDVDSVMNQLLFRVTKSADTDIAAELREAARDPRISRAFSGRTRCAP